MTAGEDSRYQDTIRQATLRGSGVRAAGWLPAAWASRQTPRRLEHVCILSRRVHSFDASDRARAGELSDSRDGVAVGDCRKVCAVKEKATERFALRQPFEELPLSPSVSPSQLPPSAGRSLTAGSPAGPSETGSLEPPAGKTSFEPNAKGKRQRAPSPSEFSCRQGIRRDACASGARTLQRNGNWLRDKGFASY